MKEFKNIVVAGGGVLGSQIAFQAAYCGFNVTIWLRSEGSIGRTQPKLAHLKETYLSTIQAMAAPDGKSKQIWACGIADYDDFDAEKCAARVEAAAASIHLELDLAKAVEDADRDPRTPRPRAAPPARRIPAWARTSPSEPRRP